jgi:hypothetical protein
MPHEVIHHNISVPASASPKYQETVIEMSKHNCDLSESRDIPM